MKRSNLFILSTLLLLGTVQACKRKVPAKNYNDTKNSGEATFVADESFAPILEQELYIFKNENRNAKINMVYRSESDVVKYLLSDSSRFAFLSRDLTADEKQMLKEHSLPAIITKFAIDGIAIIANETAIDTSISVSDVKKMLTGKTKTDKNIVFDNPSSSLVRYLKEFTGEKEFKQKNIYALKSNKEVIDYVSKNPKAIGIVSFSWVNDPDADYADAVKKIKVLAMNDDSDKKTANQYFRPSQTTLYLNQYPLMRYLYIVNCTGRDGLGYGFEHFIADEKGQRIILRSGLLPIKIPHRDILIVHKDKM